MLFLQFLNNVSIIKTKVLLPRAHVTVANSRACGSYQDFLDRGLLLTRKLLNLVKLKSSLRKFDRYGLSVSQITTDIFHFPVLSSFMTYHRVCNYIKMTGATSGAGTVYPFGPPELTPGA
jgi:hypothetical protein